MEDQAEKMEALKKAYAEIILNTAKEAAARAMASECKALRFHHDLRHTKDEARQMLLRFKNMIDSTTTEAEKTSLNQQKRINELDSKLNETEEVIINLREEISKAHERLEEAKNSNMQHSENKHMDNSETTPSEYSNSCNSAKENNFFITNPNLSSTTIGNKEPELYRNGYTHRIRAIENNLMDENNNSDEKTKKDEIFTENSSCNLRRSIRKRKVRCWDEVSSLFKSRPVLSQCNKYSDINDVEFDKHGHKSKSLAEVNQTSVSISPSTIGYEDNKYDEKHEVSVKNGDDKNRGLKYTFSRKRKRDLLSESDNTKLLNEEVEVACQLMSLSGSLLRSSML